MDTAKKRILIADHDPDILDVTRIILEQMGDFEVATTIIDENFITKMEDDAPDLILFDLGLQSTGSRKVCESLKTQEKTKNLPLIIFSTRMDVDKISHSIGADDFLTKPFEINNLLEKVGRLTRGTHCIL